jgi:hypothetical protein
LAFNGSGVHNRVHDWTQDLSNTIPVTASRMDAEHDDISSSLSAVICRDGQSTTTARIPFASGVSCAAGTTASVAYAQINDPNTGIYFPAADQVGIVVGGTEVATTTSSGITITGTLTPSGQLISSAGTAGAPGVTFASDLDSGLYHIGANNLGVAVNGAKVLDIGTAGLGVTGTLTSSGALTVSTNGAAITGNSTITGALGVSGNFAINTDKFTVAAASGNTAVAGTLDIAGALTGSGAISGATAAGAMVASQSEMEAAAATNKLVTAGRARYHPGVAKAWVAFSGSDGAITASHNVSSVGRSGTGNYSIAVDTDFTGTGFVAVATALHTGAAVVFVSSRAAGSIGLAVTNVAGAAIDPTGVMVAFYGDQ